MPENDDTRVTADTDSYADSTVDVTDVLSDRALDGFVRARNIHSPMMPLLCPPIPLRDVTDAVGENDEYVGRLFALADLARGFNKIGDPTMAEDTEWDEETEELVELDDPRYPITQESVDELKLATHAVYAVYHRELEALATELGVTDNPDYERERQGETSYDYSRAIRDYFGYDPMQHDLKKSVRDIADDLDVSPSDVYNVLHNAFGDDAERLTLNVDTEPLTSLDDK